ncbi:MAG: RDD family protein [Planctomycetes bacterium]|nr:RDD family protein [Planctomycetota bacterium]
MITTLVLVALGGVATPAAQGDGLWFAWQAPEDDAVTKLCLQGLDSLNNEYVVLRDLSGVPQGLAAHASSVWVLPQQKDGETVSLLALRADWDSQMESWRTAPAAGFDRLPPCDVNGAVELLIGGSMGPVLVSREPDATRVSIHTLRRGSWAALPEFESEYSMIAGIADGSDISLLTQAKAGTAVLWRWTESTQVWAETELSIDSGVAHDLARSGRSLLLGVQDSDDRRLLGYVQDGSIAPWTSLEDVSAGDRLLESEAALCLFRIQDESPSSRRIDQVSGTASPWTPLTLRSNLGGRIWSLVVSMSIALVVVLMLVFGRSSMVGVLPEGLAPAPLTARGIAFLLDFIPAIVAIPLVLGASPLDLGSAVLTGPIPATVPILLTAAVTTVVWGIVWEVPTGQTPGKRLMGFHVAMISGEEVGWWRSVLRNMLKGVTILVPPLAIIVVLGPLGQGPGDVATGTVVVRIKTEAKKL